MNYNKQIRFYCLKKSGFTLVEVMVAVFISTIVLSSAYMIWSRVQLGISKSVTKQNLQNELRKVANYMQNDFKSIKFHDSEDENDTDADKAVKITGDDKNFTMTFQKFKEVEESDKNKLTQDVVENVKYSLNSNVLMRTSGNSNKMLSAHCDGITITTAAGDNNEEGDYQNATEDVKMAKEAQLNIEITGKMIVPGSGEEMFHTEKTSVVMRNEYYKKINNNYKSNFDLAKIDADDIIGEEEAGVLSGNFEEDPEKLKEYLNKLDTEVLGNMQTSEEEVKKSLENNLEEINKTIADIAPEDVPWYEKLWANITSVFGDDEQSYTQFKEARADLEKANTVKEANDAIKDLKIKIEKQEKGFYVKAYTKQSFDSMTTEEKTTFRRAYDMAVQEKTLNDAYEQLEDKSGGKPKSNIEVLKEALKEGKATEEQKKIIDIYNDINLDWMEDSDSEIGIYKANKQLMDQANTKLELLKSKETTERNIDAIKEELGNRK